MIIGLNGKMGVGKSTAFKAIQEYFKEMDRHTKLVKFAQPLYDMQEYIYGRIEDVHKRPETFVKDRKLLQWLGTEWGRDTISQTLWVDIWSDAAQRNSLHGRNVVCDDVRFDNEAEAIKAMGGIVIHITSGEVDARDVVTNGIKAHSSENGIKKELIDYTIDNNGSLEQFKALIRSTIGDAIAVRINYVE